MCNTLDFDILGLWCHSWLQYKQFPLPTGRRKIFETIQELSDFVELILQIPNCCDILHSVFSFILYFVLQLMFIFFHIIYYETACLGDIIWNEWSKCLYSLYEGWNIGISVNSQPNLKWMESFRSDAPISP